MLFKAQEKKLVEFELINLRDFGIGPRRQVDDTPYGGGDGMLIKPEPIFSAVESVKAKDPDTQVILMTPKGELWSQELARKFAKNTELCFRSAVEEGSLTPTSSRTAAPATRKDGLARERTTESKDSVFLTSPAESGSEERGFSESPLRYAIICPHYEGYDERILTLVDHQISIGKYILTGGELPAMVIIDSITRLIPGVLGGETSAEIESFSDGDNLEYPQYTRPEIFNDMKVPDVLLSGNHGAIAKWRAEHSSWT